jgi:hypothetical protein
MSCQTICQHVGGREDFNPRSYTQQQLLKTYLLMMKLTRRRRTGNSSPSRECALHTALTRERESEWVSEWVSEAEPIPPRSTVIKHFFVLVCLPCSSGQRFLQFRRNSSKVFGNPVAGIVVQKARVVLYLLLYHNLVFSCFFLGGDITRSNGPFAMVHYNTTSRSSIENPTLS